jgi:hypothetical protein
VTGEEIPIYSTGQVIQFPDGRSIRITPGFTAQTGALPSATTNPALGPEYYNPTQPPGPPPAGMHWEWLGTGAGAGWTLQSGTGAAVGPGGSYNPPEPGAAPGPTDTTGLAQQNPGWSEEMIATWQSQILPNNPNASPSDYTWVPGAGWLRIGSPAELSTRSGSVASPGEGQIQTGWTIDPATGRLVPKFGADPGYTGGGGGGDFGGDPSATFVGEQGAPDTTGADAGLTDLGGAASDAAGALGDFGGAASDAGGAVGDLGQAAQEADPRIAALQSKISELQAYVSPTRLLLNQLQATHEQGDLQQALTDAQANLAKAQYLGDPAVIKQAMKDLADAQYNLQVADMEKQATAEEQANQAQIDLLQKVLDQLQAQPCGTTTNPLSVSIVNGQVVFSSGQTATGKDGAVVITDPTGAVSRTGDYSTPVSGTAGPFLPPGVTLGGDPSAYTSGATPYTPPDLSMFQGWVPMQHGGPVRRLRLPRVFPNRWTDSQATLLSPDEYILNHLNVRSTATHFRQAEDLKGAVGDLVAQLHGGGGNGGIGWGGDLHVHGNVIHENDLADVVERALSKKVRRTGRLRVR